MNNRKLKRRKRRSDGASVLGIAWYRPEQWERLFEISVECDKLEKTYEEWRHYIEKTLRKMRKAGIRYIKVDIDTEELLRWCQSHKCVVDADSRSAYTADKLRRQETNKATS